MGRQPVGRIDVALGTRRARGPHDAGSNSYEPLRVFRAL